MRLNSDFILYHPLWEKADDLLINQHKLFNRLIDIFLIACSIGIKDDKQIPNEAIENQLSQPKNIGRNTYQSAINTDLDDTLTLMLQNAIINSNYVSFDLDERLKLAFNPDYDNKKFSAATTLISFANYGIEQIFKNINTDLPSMTIADDLYKYLNSLKDDKYDDLVANITLEDMKK